MSKKRTLSGFTLVEVTTSILIMSILISIASSVIIVGVNIFAKNAILRAAQNDGNNVYNFLYDRISYAASLKVNASDDIVIRENYDYYEVITIDAEKNCMYVQRGNGDIDKNGSKYFIYGSDDGEEADNRLHGNICKVEFSEYSYNDDTITFSVTIERDGDIYYFKEGTIPLYNKPFLGSENSYFVKTSENPKIQTIAYYYYDYKIITFDSET